MSKSDDDTLQQVADAFGTTLDPLAEFEAKFRQLDVDTFEPFVDDVLVPDDLHTATMRQYRSAFEQWATHMEL